MTSSRVLGPDRRGTGERGRGAADEQVGDLPGDGQVGAGLHEAELAGGVGLQVVPLVLVDHEVQCGVGESEVAHVVDAGGLDVGGCGDGRVVAGGAGGAPVEVAVGGDRRGEDAVVDDGHPGVEAAFADQGLQAVDRAGDRARVVGAAQAGGGDERGVALGKGLDHHAVVVFLDEGACGGGVAGQQGVGHGESGPGRRGELRGLVAGGAHGGRVVAPDAQGLGLEQAQ